MSDFQEGWYVRDSYNNWFFVGNDKEVAKYIMDMGECGEEFAESIIQEDFDNMDSGILCLVKSAIEFAWEMHQTHTKEDIYRMFLADYVESICHDGDYPIIVTEEDVNHVFTWAECEEDLEIE